MIASTPWTAGNADDDGTPICGVRIRAVIDTGSSFPLLASESGLDELRAVVGNATALEAYRAGTHVLLLP